MSGLAAEHSDWFPEAVSEDEMDHLRYDGTRLDERVHAEKEWLITGDYRIVSSEMVEGYRVLTAVPVDK